MPPFPHEQGKLLSTVCSFAIGGPARYFAAAHTADELKIMLQFARQQNLPFMILGKGSNCLFDDRGFNGLVIHNKIDYLSKEGGLYTVSAGYSFARLGKETAREGWTGLEFASGIPATVGGAIYMNAGATGQETKDPLVSVTYITEQGEIKTFQKAELFFDYRFSSFQKMKGAIIEGVFQLQPSAESKKNQKQLLDYRLKTQPYKDKSAGCAFKNPLGTGAGKLIDECGLKNMQVGGAQVSSLHANFIINAGGATASDVLELVAKIKEKIHAEKGILLEDEICYIPYDDSIPR